MTGTGEGREQLVGRATLVDRVQRALADGGGAVLHGPTGVGKSAIARHVAATRAAGRGPALWVQGTPGLADVPLGALLALLARDAGASAELDGRPAELARRLLAAVPASTACAWSTTSSGSTT